MFVTKIKQKQSGILLYGITPPKAHSTAEKIETAAEKLREILNVQDIDALVVYDVQDESARTSEERPFPYASSLDPFYYASNHLQDIDLPKIIYRPAGMFSKEELSQWLDDLKGNRFYPIFVGLPTPDYPVKTSLQEAYEIWRTNHQDHSVIGAVTIPERHALLSDEQIRILDKVSCGVSFFVTQCIFNVEYTRQILDDLQDACSKNNQELPTIIFTLTICGSLKTLDFMEWLGIHIPEDIKDQLKKTNDHVAHSLGIAVSIANELIDYCTVRSIPFGFNIESVATRKVEVEASVELLNQVRSLLQSKGLREIKGEEISLSTRNF